MIRKAVEIPSDLAAAGRSEIAAPCGWTWAGLEKSAGGSALQEAVGRARLVLEIVPGERRLLREFGCRVHRLARIQTQAERHVAAALMEEAIERWVPDLHIDKVEVLGVEEGSIHVALSRGGAWCELRIAHRSASPGSPVEDEELRGQMPASTAGALEDERA